MKAIFFGSIGSVIETSKLQYDAFNKAFLQHDLGWHWELDQYREMLKISGGAKRVASFAKSRGETVDAAAVHATKTQIFLDDLASNAIQPLAHVIDILKDAEAMGLKTGFVSTTEKATLEIIIAKLQALGQKPFDVVTHRGLVTAEKPQPDAYAFAVNHVGVDAEDCIAVEDNLDGVSAAKAAGVRVIGVPGAYTHVGDLGAADVVASGDILATLRAQLKG